jgi:hypothetical protein
LGRGQIVEDIAGDFTESLTEKELEVQLTTQLYHAIKA